MGLPMTLKIKYKNELIDIIHKHLPKCEIYLFGSQATGKNRPGSDIDLALNTGQKIPYTTIMKILVDIDQTIIPMKVDLVDWHVTQIDLQNSILKEGIKWTK